MTRKILLESLLVLGGFALIVKAQEGQQGKEHGQPPAMTEEQQKEMEAWMKAGTPNEKHEILAQLTGEWTYQMKWWDEGQSEPMEMSGKCNRKMIMGGRYLSCEYEGDGWGGMPFQGMSILAYDNIQKKYVETWIDNMSTMIMISEGEADDSGKKITLTATMIEPGGKKVRHKWETQIVNNNKTTLTGWDITKGEPRKMAELTFDRSN